MNIYLNLRERIAFGEYLLHRRILEERILVEKSPSDFFYRAIYLKSLRPQLLVTGTQVGCMTTLLEQCEAGIDRFAQNLDLGTDFFYLYLKEYQFQVIQT